MAYATAGQQAGLTAATTSAEAALFGGPAHLQWMGADKLVSTAVDAGNTPTTTLRPGLILGRIASSGLLTAYNSDATDGSEVPVCVLSDSLSMVGGSGAVENKDCNVLYGGVLTLASGAIGGITGQDGALDANARKVLGRQFIFDDALPAQALGYRIIPAATSATVTAAQNGALFVATAAATFTLPTIALGLEYEFLMTANTNLAITGASGTILRDTSNVAGTTATFSTSSQKLGANASVRAIYVGSTLMWQLKNLCGFTITMS
ncbi:MAG: hypothetical protein QM811_07010 [Pirellulales bacterium]